MSDCDQSNCQLIDANTLNAYYRPILFTGGGFLTIEATGECQCPQCAAVTRVPTSEPPEFNLVTCNCLDPVNGPYSARGVFIIPRLINTVTVYTAAGTQLVPVVVGGDAEVAGPAPPADDEVIGLSPNSVDVDRAIRDAVSQLRKKYPSGVSAKVTELGFWAFGKPVGLAALYVRMQQQQQQR
jgi:hypothetical protein